MLRDSDSSPDRYSTSNKEPPITVDTLSELNFENLYNNLLLRHDLNFDLRISYRRSASGIQGERKKAEMAKYWEDVRTELPGWLLEKGLSLDCCSSDCRCPIHTRRDRGPGQRMVVRLRQIFRTLFDIVKSLLPDDEIPGIDLRLDINLLIQELENDACDFLLLNEWLSALLRRQCSPDTHRRIDSMTIRIQNGIEHLNDETILDGLQQIFDILETMKLVRRF